MEIYDRVMKNKRITYALVLAVAFTWGLIFYQVFESMGGKGPGPGTAQPVAEALPVADPLLDTVSLRANYPDPFLRNAGALARQGESRTVRQVSYPAPPAAPAAPAPPATPAVRKTNTQPDLGFVTYMGSIHNPKSKKIVALLSLHGREYAVSEGEVIDSIRILKTSRDSLKVSYRNTTKWLKRF